MRFALVIGVLLVGVGGTWAIDCAGGWESIGNNCFLFESSKTSYQEGRNICAALYSGADLAIIDDANVHREIYERIFEFGLSGNFWLGGSDASVEGDWRWVNDDRVSFGTPFWAIENGLLSWDQEPLGGSAENCLVLEATRLYYFDDRSCFDSNYALCMY